MSDCRKCARFEECAVDENCGLFVDKPMTNSDLVRAMTDEGLAETYAGGCPNGDRLNCGKYYLHGGRDCFNCWLDWLKSPVEVEE